MNTSTFLCQLLIVAIANLIGKDNGGHKFITIKIEPLSGEPKFHLGSGSGLASGSLYYWQ